MSKTPVAETQLPEIRFEATAYFDKRYKALKKRYSSLPADFSALREMLQAAPQSGDAIGKNCYKVRLSIESKHTGKSGDARVITLVLMLESLIIFLDIYDKSEQDTISDKERDALIKELSQK